VMNTLEMVQMSGMERRLPNQLSGGQKQRVAIARALAPEPKLLLMDEPLSSLDAKLREQMRWQLMDIVSRTGVTTLYVTHDQVEALTMADHIVLLNQGEIEQEGSPRELYSSPQTLFCASFIGTSNLLACHIVQVKEKSALVDCQGFQLTVSMGLDALGGSAVCMIRPSDLSLGNTFDAWANSVGTTTWVIIQQRAYLGDHWQYRVKLSSHPHMTLEVWDSVEHHVGKTVALHIPAAAARLIRPKGNSLQSAPSPSVSSVVHQGKQEVRLL
jgi:ABC-type Fe3+/spermidine/putrescine transport system ATPase subunit